MSRLIESIKLLDGEFYNLRYHEQRMLRSLKALYGFNSTLKLGEFLRATEFPARGMHKCRIVYDEASTEISFAPYTPKRIAQVKIVEGNEIAYEFKFEDRAAIDRLFNFREGCDDILITKNGAVTDCSFSNIVFRSGEIWYTPASALLKGTMRQNLIDKNYIQEKEIHKNDIPAFETFKIINAMLEFDSPEIEVSNIVF
jgi:4-amino-4-deoxychorismate lyase